MHKKLADICSMLFVFALTGTSGSALAAFADCNLSGQSGLVWDLNDNDTPNTPGNGDGLYVMQYDPVTGQAGYLLETSGGRTGLMDVSNVSSDAITLNLPGFGVIFSKILGNPVYNHGQFTHPQGQGTACGTLVDSNNDNQADRLVLQMGSYNGAPSVLMDHPLQYYPDAMSPSHWWLPNPFPYAPSLFGTPSPTVDIGNDYFAPIDAMNSLMYVSCDSDNLRIETSLTTSANGPGPCPIGGTNAPIPTVSFWGYAALILLMMAAGIRLMRKGGFGDDFNMRA